MFPLRRAASEAEPRDVSKLLLGGAFSTTIIALLSVAFVASLYGVTYFYVVPSIDETIVSNGVTADMVHAVGNESAANTEAIQVLATFLGNGTSNVTDLVVQINSNTADIAALQPIVADNLADTAILSNNVTDISARVDANEADIAALEAEVATNTANISDVSDRVDVNEADIIALAAMINSTDLAEIYARIDANAANITTLEARVDANEDDIVVLTTDVATNAANITDLSARVDANEADISALTPDVATNTANITDLSGRVDVNEVDIAALTTDVATNTANITDLSGRVDVNEADIAMLFGIIGNYTANVTDLSAQVAANTADISTLNGEVLVNAANISDISALIDANAALIPGLTNTAEVVGNKTLVNKAAFNALFAQVAANNIYTYWVDNLLGIDNSTCGTSAAPCMTLEYVMGILPDGKSVKIAFVANGPSNPYTFDGTGITFTRGLTTSLTFIAPSQLSDNRATPFANWGNLVTSDSRTDIYYYGYYPWFGNIAPTDGTSVAVGTSGNTASGNLNGVSADDARCTAVNKASSASIVTRYTPAHDLIYMSTGYYGEPISLYAPNAVVEMTNVNVNFPLRVYGLDMRFKGATTISAELTAIQSRVQFENDTTIDIHDSIKFISSCMISGSDASLTISASDIIFSDESLMSTIGSSISIQASEVVISESVISGESVADALVLSSVYLFLYKSLSIASLNIDVGNGYLSYSSIATNFDGQGGPDVLNTPLTSNSPNPINIERTSFISYTAASVTATVGCASITGGVNFFEMSCVPEGGGEITYDTLFDIYGGTSTGTSLFVNIFDQYTYNVISLSSAAKFQNSDFYSLNANGTANIVNSIIAYEGAVEIVIHSTLKLNGIPPSTIYSTSDSNSLIYASATQKFIADATGSGDIFYSSDLVAFADHFIYQRNDLGLSKSLVPAPGMTYDSGDVLNADGTWNPPYGSSTPVTAPWTPTVSYPAPCAASSVSGYYTTVIGSGEMVEATFKANLACGPPPPSATLTFNIPVGSISDPVNSIAGQLYPYGVLCAFSTTTQVSCDFIAPFSNEAYILRFTYTQA